MNNLSIAYQNVRGLRTKSDVFLTSVIANDQDIICLTETWLNNLHFTSDYFPNCYSVFRADRPDPNFRDVRGGGSLIAVKKSLVFSRRFDLEGADECVFVEVKLKNNTSLLLGTGYFSPTTAEAQYQGFKTTLIQKLTNYDGQIIILGDFNLPGVDWDQGSSQGCSSSTRLKATHIFDLCYDINLNQINTFKGSGSLLDLCLTNINGLNCTAINDPFVPIDKYHPPFLIQVSAVFYTDTAPLNPVYDFAKGDYYLLYALVRDFDWSVVLDSSDVNYCVDTLTQCLITSMDSAIPKKIPSFNRNFPHWYSRELQKAIKQKKYFYKKKLRTGALDDFVSYRTCRSLVRKLIERDRSRMANRVCQDALSHPKKFWNFVNGNLKECKNLISLKIDNTMVVDSEELGKTFVEHFSKISCDDTVKGDKYVFDTSGIVTDPYYTDVITPSDIYKAIMNLPNKFSTGLDGIPTFIVKGCLDLLLPVLEYIFNLSFRSKTFPDLWKKSLVVPVYKSGASCNVKNYRPISLLCVLAKVFDRVVHQKLQLWFGTLPNDCQHGFTPGRGVESNHMAFLDFVAPEVESRGQIDVIYLDLAKAFDRVSHSFLRDKLQALGVTGDILGWIMDYLTDRINILKCNNRITSKTYAVSCGVPQGSSLGPLLFNIYIYDLQFSVQHSNLLQFADDNKVSKIINSQIDSIHLQEDLDAIAQWCTRNNIPINPSKSAHVTYTRRVSRAIMADYRIGDNQIPVKNSIRDLGVIFDRGLYFSDHVNKSVNICRRTLSISLKICRKLKSLIHFRVLYLALVRSRVMYGWVAWGGCCNYLRQRLESIQRKFVEYCHSFFVDKAPYDYLHLLAILDLPTIDHVCKMLEIKFVFKLVHNIVQLPKLLQKLNFVVPRTIRYHKTFSEQVRNLNPINRIQRTCNLFVDTIDIFSVKLKDIT